MHKLDLAWVTIVVLLATAVSLSIWALWDHAEKDARCREQGGIYESNLCFRTSAVYP